MADRRRADDGGIGWCVADCHHQSNIPMYWGTQTWAPAEVNRALRDEAARRPNLHVVDWDALSAGHLPGSADPWYMPDGLHHTSAGETAFEAAILGTLAQCEEER
jgi:hypothetical protein